jgi:hypothetical protein
MQHSSGKSGPSGAIGANWFFAYLLTALTVVFAAMSRHKVDLPWKGPFTAIAVERLLACQVAAGNNGNSKCQAEATELSRRLTYRAPGTSDLPHLAWLNVRVIDNALIYRRVKCNPIELPIEPITLNITARDRSALPDERRSHGFQSLDFEFKDIGYIVEGNCLAVISLPNWHVSNIVTGHYVRGEKDYRWRAIIEF